MLITFCLHLNSVSTGGNWLCHIFIFGCILIKIWLICIMQLRVRFKSGFRVLLFIKSIIMKKKHFFPFSYLCILITAIAKNSWCQYSANTSQKYTLPPSCLTEWENLSLSIHRINPEFQSNCLTHITCPPLNKNCGKGGTWSDWVPGAQDLSV